MLVIIKFLTWIASPIGVLVWGSLVGLLLLAIKCKRTAGLVLVFAKLQLVIFSLPIVASSLVGGLENRARLLETRNAQAERILSGQKYAAIVLLGGATSPANPPQRPYPELDDAVDRIWHAARLYKQGLAPKIILSGGRIPGMEAHTTLQTEAQAMRLLLIDLGVPDSALVLEDESRTTRENAEKTKALVGDQRVALVTSAFHMPRSIENFKKAGIQADAYPTDFQVIDGVEPPLARILPKAKSLRLSEIALKEYLALAIQY